MSQYRPNSRWMAVILLALLLPILASCAAQGAPNTDSFVTMAPPAVEYFPMNLFYAGSAGNVSQTIDLIGTDAIVKYREITPNIGGVRSETVQIPGPNDTMRSAVMTTLEWGDWNKARVKKITYYSATRGQIIMSMIQLSVPEASIFQLFQGRMKYQFDKSRLYLVFLPSAEGGTPVLTSAIYNESSGLGSSRLNMGETAIWTQAQLSFLPAQFHEWGFWEGNTNTFQMVTAALDATEKGLANTAPNFATVDLDGIDEVIGRQTGFQVFSNGNAAGSIDFTYSNLLGRQPNTPLFGSGALSRVDWHINGEYYGLIIFSPPVLSTPSTLYVFVDDEQAATDISKINGNVLIGQIRKGLVPHVTMAVYEIGDVTKQIQVIHHKEAADETVDLGTFGGVFYTAVGSPSWQAVSTARQHLDMLGQDGISAIGFGYPTGEGKGSGLHYYLSLLQVITCDPAAALKTLGCDVGLLDRTGMPVLK